MAELNHRFHKGRMNKDLDERLVPNGEYRNALNVEVVSSEDSNIGSLQTIMGNVDLSTNLIDPYGILDGYCVASIVDEQNENTPFHSELFQLYQSGKYENLTLTPHVAGVTTDSQEIAFRSILDLCMKSL